jgi:uncharacterized LabA/DUF88 family protein
MATPNTERRIALFIDFENLVTNTGITPASFDLKPSLDQLLEKGKVIFRRAYCDWSRFEDAKRGLHEHGVELTDVPPSTRSGKNGADMRLVIDALELNYARQHIDTFVIASGDSDFCPLAYKLRENDRLVIGLAVREAASPLFVKACDEFIYVRRAKREEARTQPRRHDKAEPSRRGSGGAVPEVARQVVASLLARATGPINPSLIKETIVRKQPDFDERDHGFSSFSRLLEAMEKQGLCRRITQGRQVYIGPAEGPSRTESAPAESHESHEPHEANDEPDEPTGEEEEIIADPSDEIPY